MDEVSTILFLTIAAGSCIPQGGYIASFERICAKWPEQELRHFVIALGGGILVGAVALVLVPEGIASMGRSLLAIPILLMGGFSAGVVDLRAQAHDTCPR